MARMQPSPLNPFGSAAPFGLLGARGVDFIERAALVVRLALRRDCGRNLVSPGNIILVTLGMLFLHWFDNVHFGLYTLFGGGVIYGNHIALLYFAIAWAALATFEKLKRLEEEKRGEHPHTYSPGVSRFDLEECLPIDPRWIARVVEPGLAFLSGAVCRRLGLGMLGWVIICSAICFCISECRLYQRTKKHILDRGDIGLEAQWEADLLKQNAQRKASAAGGTTPGLATGIDGLEDSIGKLRQERAGEAAGGGAL
jgi:hypothetical protein